MCFGLIVNPLAIIKKYSYIVENNFSPMYYTTTTNDSVHYAMKMQPIDDISVGDIIEMVKSGKEFLVESITPKGIILKECTTYVSFSRSALNERLKRNVAIHKPI